MLNPNYVKLNPPTLVLASSYLIREKASAPPSPHGVLFPTDPRLRLEKQFAIACLHSHLFCVYDLYPPTIPHLQKTCEPSRKREKRENVLHKNGNGA